QTAVDTQHHLIVAHEVTNVGSDRHQLKRMSEQAREAIGSQELTALADRGYYSGEEIKACDDAGIVPLVPKVFTSNSKAEGRYDKSDTTSDYRGIGRWEHEAVLDKMQERLDANPEAVRMRRRTVEHPFGTIKAWMGATHFLCRRLPKV